MNGTQKKDLPHKSTKKYGFAGRESLINSKTTPNKEQVSFSMV